MRECSARIGESQGSRSAHAAHRRRLRVRSDWGGVAAAARGKGQMGFRRCRHLRAHDQAHAHGGVGSHVPSYTSERPRSRSADPGVRAAGFSRTRVEHGRTWASDGTCIPGSGHHEPFQQLKRMSRCSSRRESRNRNTAWERAHGPTAHRAC